MPPKKRKSAAGEKPSPKKGKRKQNADEDDEISEASDDNGDEPAKDSTSSSSESENYDSDAKTKDGNPWNFKISSWNVSGIRAWVKKGGLEYLEKENPDIFVLQETKCGEKDIPAAAKNVHGYRTYWYSPKSKSGYSGVGLFTKTEPISVEYGLGIEKHDEEGRLITAEYNNFYLVSTYIPNSGRGLVRLAYRREWNEDLLAYLKRLDETKPVILCGDLNVAHHPIDLARPQSNTKSAGFTKEEREDFTTLLNSGFVDTFRYFHPTKKDAYTFWSYLNNARAKNIGWRLDYFVVSERLVDNLCDSVIRSKVMGSDHCPLALLMAL